MFWHNNYAPSVQIDSLLSEEDISLNKLMDAEDILQECKSQNKKLIEYLTRSDILEELVILITEEPSLDLEERWRYKYSNVACELLTSDVPVLTEKLASNEMLLSKLHSFIDKDEPLNPLLASFFSKTLYALLRRASDQNWISHQFVCLQVLESLKSRKNCVDLLLQHIQTSAIMDLILILLSKIEGDEMRQNIHSWLDDQQLIQRLIKLLSPSSDPKKHANVSQLICDIIKLPRVEPEKRPDLILQTLQLEDTIKLILDTILTGKKIESSIVGGVRILINLLGQKLTSITESTEAYGVSYNNIVEDEQREKFALIIVPYLSSFNELLLHPPDKLAVKTTVGFLEKPFGRTRLYILKLYVGLLSTDNLQVIQYFVETDTFSILLDLFFQFAWNNFLHTQVQQCLSSAINSKYSRTSELLYDNIFVKSRYIDRILEAWEDNHIKKLNEETKIRSGYMGHLIIMANEVVKRIEECNVLSDFLRNDLSVPSQQRWESFVTSELDEINKKQRIVLGEPPETYMITSSGNSDDYAAFPQDSYCQELLYSNYDEQTTVPIYEDNEYNFQGEKLDDSENNFNNLVDQLHNKPFNITNDDFQKRQKLFNKICDEKKFDNQPINDEWQDNDFQMPDSGWLNKKKNNSSSSDEEDDPWDSDKSQSLSNTTAINLWNVDTPEPVTQTGWANFDNFNNATNSEVVFQNKLSEDFKIEVPKVSTTINSVCSSKTENNIHVNVTENKVCNIESDNTKVMIEEINSSVLSIPECTKSTGTQDSNANLTFPNVGSEIHDASKYLKDNSLFEGTETKDITEKYEQDFPSGSEISTNNVNIQSTMSVSNTVNATTTSENQLQ